MAKVKNVAMTPEQCAKVAAAMIDSFDPAVVHRLTNSEPEAVTLAAAAINRLLDVCAATQVLHLMHTLQGFDILDPRKLAAQAQAWVDNLLANDEGRNQYRWPDPMEMVTKHYKARSSGPVSVTMPVGQGAGVGYFVDPSASRRSAKARMQKGPTSMLEPLLIFCPSLPGSPGDADPAEEDGHA
jgi:hypothetical protein